MTIFFYFLPQHLTIAPFLPFQSEDLKSILRSRIQYLDAKYEGIHWKRLHLSNTAIDYFLSTDHVEYFDLLTEDDNAITFSLRGAKALEGNALVQAFHAKLINGTRRRPHKIAFVDMFAVHDEMWQTVLSWCDDTDTPGQLEKCEEDWRLVLS